MGFFEENNIYPSETNVERLLSGARLTAGGLHLGHYLGCFTSFGRFVGKADACFFIVLDRYDYPLGTDIRKCKRLFEMVADIVSIQSPLPVYVVLESQIHNCVAPIAEWLNAKVTLTQLQNVHPSKKWIKASQRNVRIADFLFPIQIAALYAVMDCNYLLANDDSRRFVQFAKTLFRKVHNECPDFSAKAPALVHGIEPRLTGWNYRKMSKGNNNAMFLSDTNAVIGEKIEQLFDYRQLKRAFPEKVNLSGATFNIPPEFAPFSFLKAFMPERGDLIAACSEPAKHSFVKSELQSELSKLIQPIRERREKLLQSPDTLQSIVETGTSKASEIATKTSQALVNALTAFSQA